MKNDDIILMGHGGGGKLTGILIRDLILKHLGNPILARLDDGACLDLPSGQVVFTTDSYVIDPIFFPGGDIGEIAVCGTVNDLVMQGARPLYLSLSLIIQEGLLISDLERIIISIRDAASKVGVQIVTGDTKVVDGSDPKGGIYINTAGIGERLPGVDVSVANAREGDVVIVTGTIGDHGVAIMNEREGLGMRSSLESDTAPLWGMMEALFVDPSLLHCLRDPTRGGVAAAVCDMAEASSCSIRLNEAALPVKDEVKGACGLLGLEPLNIANEGKALIVCAAERQEYVLETLRGHELGKNACVIGEVLASPSGRVVLTTRSGGERIVDVPAGEDLPRIC